MNQTALETFSAFGVGILCITLAIMTLSIFFQVLSRLGRGGAKAEPLSVRGVIKKDTWATVHMAGKEIFERVRIIGFTNAESTKGQLPWELNNMIILEDPSHKRFIIRGKDIRMIVIEPVAGGGEKKDA